MVKVQLGGERDQTVGGLRKTRHEGVGSGEIISPAPGLCR